MSGLQQLAPTQRDEILLDSIRRKVQVALCVQQETGFSRRKGRFLAGSAASDGLKIEVFSASDGDGPLNRDDRVGVSFRVGHKKCMFRASVEDVEPRGRSVVVGMKWPAHLRQLQRRSYERVAPPPGVVIAVRFWRSDGGPTSSGQSRDVRHGQLEDLSAGGLRLLVGDCTGLELEKEYQCIFAARTGDCAVLAPGVLRHIEALPSGRASLGFQFLGLEATEEGTTLLGRIARVVSQFKSTRARRGG